jgi:hypothetical protein
MANEYDAITPAYAGDLSPQYRSTPPRPEPPGILALPPDAVPQLLNGPRYGYGLSAGYRFNDDITGLPR